MRQFVKQFLPQRLIWATRILRELDTWKSLHEWRTRGFLGHSPQLVKQNMFLKYGIPNAVWVETGTYTGETTEFLRQRFSHVYSIEPGAELYRMACKKFAGKNVSLFNDISENVFPLLLPTLKGSVNFWLDGHYSGGITFEGPKRCPIEDELREIAKGAIHFEKLVILIDDVRCFLPSHPEHEDYPSIDYLVDWARSQNFSWQIEHDIFVIQKS